MSRKKHRIDRKTPPDSVYGSILISKFINNLMRDGKKSVAEKLFYTAASKVLENHKEAVDQKGGFAPWFENIVSSLKPSFGLKSKRIGGSTYQIPIELPLYAAVSVSIKMLVSVIRSKSGRSTAETLYLEMISIMNSEGDCVRRKNEFEKRIESSKVFVNFN